MAVAASYDQTGRYGAQNPFSDQLASHWEGGKWEVDSMHDSLVTVGNGGSKPARAELTIIYDQGSEQYQIEQTLAPDEQMLVDVGKLIRNQVPDKNGHVLPPDLTSGAYRIRDLADSAAGGVYEGKVIVDKTYGHAAYGCGICCGPEFALMEFNPLAVIASATSAQQVQAPNSCGGGTQTLTGDFPTWWTDDTSIATASKNQIHGVAPGTTKHYAQSIPMYWGFREDGNPCPEVQSEPSGTTNVARLSCTPSVTRGSSVTCTVTGPSGTTASAWKFKHGSGNTVTRATNTTSLTWSGVMVAGGSVSVTANSSSLLSFSITVNNRTNFAFTAVSPALLAGNSITCYNGTNVTLPSPPQSGSREGYSCADLAFSFNFATVNDNGPNNGYEYVTSASDASGSSPTQLQYIVVSDLLSTTTFYNAQCGNFSSSNATGFIAGSQLKQNVLDHEQGSVMSHWTEYVVAQNNSSNNIGTVLESSTAPPGSTGNSFAQNAGNSALNRIAQAVTVEPCGGSVAQDSSKSCASCGNINFSPYQTCTGQPVPYCN
jgi:hypothetical protein